jgi:hypothetical protein
MNPSSENQPAGRLVPDEPFPPYSFVPGQSPHPVSDPAGHSYRREPPPPPALDPQGWETSRAYLHGLDLFNAGYFWESHVQWEGLWLACGRKGAVADFLKGLIKLAAAGVKHREGKPGGVQSHAGRAAELWREVARSLGTDLFLGLRLGTLIERAETVCREGWPDAPLLLLPAFSQTQDARKDPEGKCVDGAPGGA